MKIRVLLVGVIKGANNKDVGYNIIEYVNGRARMASVPIERLQNVKIENAELTADGLKGTNGALSRYPTFISSQNGLTQVSHSIVVVSRLEDGFILSDGTGNLARLSYKDALGYFKLQGIANGKLVKRDGKEVVSAITGEYPVEPGRVEVKAEPVKGKTEKVQAKPTYSDNFYKLVEKAFGKPRAALIKYLIEARGKGSPEGFAAMIKDVSYKGIAIVGAMVVSDDAKAGKVDEKLKKIVSTIVEPKAVDFIIEQAKQGIDFDSYWDGVDIVYYERDEEKEKKYDITYSRLAACMEELKKRG